MFDKYNEYMNTMMQDKSKNTIRSYQDSIEPFLEHFKVEKISDIEAITKSQLVDYRSSINGQNSTKNARMRAIKAFMKWLENFGYIESNNMNGIKPLKEPKKVPFVFTEDEIERMVDAGFNLQEKFMILLMVTTGIRVNELVEIKLSDVNGNKILIHGKGNKERIVFIQSSIMDVLDEHVRNLNKKEEEYLFPSRRGGGKITTRAIGYRIKRIAEDAGISPERLEKVTPHKTRHYFATFLINKGVSLSYVQKAMGHEDPKTTERYAHVMDDTIEEIIESSFNININ